MFGFPSFSIFLQMFLNGILLGCMYGVAAIGLSLIFGCMEIVFIAQGAVMILAAYCVYWIVVLSSIDPLFGFLLILPIFLAFGWAMYMGLFRWVAKAGKNPSLLLAFGLMVLFENLMSVIWSPDVRTVKTWYSTATISFAEINLSVTRLIVAAVALIATGLVFLFLKKTMMGKAVRAASEDMHAASILGISPVGVSAVTFAMGIALAGVAGTAVCITYPFDPFFGLTFSLKALVAVAFGGLGSVAGALLGGVILGVLESLSSYMIGAGWADAVAYAAFLIVLIFRPEGILGTVSAEKV
jgi:branched-chain amino acid transport system permease protein